MALTGTSRTVIRARELRKDMSLPEVLLWQQLKKRPGGFKFRRQHPAGIYILDFVCMAVNLTVEVDGPVHDGEERHAADGKRDRWLAANGYRTLRIAARDVLNNMDGVLLIFWRNAVSPIPSMIQRFPTPRPG